MGVACCTGRKQTTNSGDPLKPETGHGEEEEERNRYEAHEKYSENSLDNYLESERPISINRVQISCRMCLKKFDDFDIFTNNPCGHEICRTCLSQGSRNANKKLCPYSGCKCTLNIMEVNKFWSKQLVDTYQG